KKPVVFVTDDRKEDWWKEHAGKRLGPRPELIAEFRRATGELFCMYLPATFMERIGEQREEKVKQTAIQEAQEVQESKWSEDEAAATDVLNDIFEDYVLPRSKYLQLRADLLRKALAQFLNLRNEALLKKQLKRIRVSLEAYFSRTTHHGSTMFAGHCLNVLD